MNICISVFRRQWVAAMAYAMLLLGVAFAGMDDKVLRFSTPGTDRYADGSRVLDGECYALVWSPAGTAFSGFNADGTPVSSRDRVVLAAPLAKDGRCRDAIFQVPAEEYAELEGGEWAVCLVDTRNVSGVPTGAQDGKPLRVNRWGLVQSGVTVEDASKVTASSKMSAVGMLRASTSSAAATNLGGLGTSRPTHGGVCATERSAVPDSAKTPKITAIDVLDGEVWLTVEDTEPYLSYTIISGSEPGTLKTDYFSEVIDGDNGGKIEIGTVNSPTRRFFQVKMAA